MTRISRGITNCDPKVSTISEYLIRRLEAFFAFLLLVWFFDFFPSYFWRFPFSSLSPCISMMSVNFVCSIFILPNSPENNSLKKVVTNNAERRFLDRNRMIAIVIYSF